MTVQAKLTIEIPEYWVWPVLNVWEWPVVTFSENVDKQLSTTLLDDKVFPPIRSLLNTINPLVFVGEAEKLTDRNIVKICSAALRCLEEQDWVEATLDSLSEENAPELLIADFSELDKVIEEEKVIQLTVARRKRDVFKTKEAFETVCGEAGLRLGVSHPVLD